LRRHFPILLILFTFISAAWAGVDFNELHYLPWQEADGLKPVLRQGPGGPFGPESFRYDSGTVTLLDAQANRLLVLHPDAPAREIPIPLQNTRDLLGSAAQVSHILTADALYIQQNDGWTPIWRVQDPRQPVSALNHSFDGKPIVVLNHSTSIQLDSRGSILRQTEGLLENNHVVQARLDRSGGAIVEVQDQFEIRLLSEDGPIGTTLYLGAGGGYHVVLVEIIRNQVPLEVERQVRYLDETGVERIRIGEVGIPITAPTREFRVTSGGDLLHMLLLEDGLHLIQWRVKPGSDLETRDYPAEWRGGHFDEAVEPELNDLPPGEKPGESGAWRETQTVTRSEALATGDTYVQHEWTARAENITNGQIQDPDGNLLLTPTWVQVGTNYKIPYKWGGFNTLAGYDSGLLNDKSAGDAATADVSQYAVGVDCSGFVSRCWNLATHYSTWMMVNTAPLITQPYGTWGELLPGDAIHKVGHVRLFVQHNANGTKLCVESTSNGWRVDYHTYSLSQLGSYTPRYYVNMEGMPATIAQPVVGNTTIASEAVALNWSVAGNEGLAGFAVYGESIHELENGADLAILHDEVIPPTDPYLILDDPGQETWVFEVTAIDTNGSESFPSDRYAVADLGSTERFLIVDGFDRSSGNWPLPYHEFAISHARALGKFTYSFTTADNDALVAGALELEAFDLVFWFVGDESTTDETFSDAEQALVRTYLQQGGKLFVSGSEIGWDLYSQGSAADRDFFHNVLKTDYQQDDAGSYSVTGVAGTDFAELSFNYDDGNHGIYEEDYPDAFLGEGGSVPVLRYGNNLIAATAFSGTLDGGTAACQVMIMGFPFETIYPADNRLALMKALLAHFGYSTILATEPAIVAESFRLDAPYPNPFNASTRIHFSLAKDSPVALRLFDVTGREVWHRDHSEMTAGEHEFALTNEKLASGVYMLQLATPTASLTRKVTLLQ